jgi:hypothetical protein
MFDSEIYYVNLCFMFDSEIIMLTFIGLLYPSVGHIKDMFY